MSHQQLQQIECLCVCMMNILVYLYVCVYCHMCIVEAIVQNISYFIPYQPLDVKCDTAPSCVAPNSFKSVSPPPPMHTQHTQTMCLSEE